MLLHSILKQHGKPCMKKYQCEIEVSFQKTPSTTSYKSNSKPSHF